MNNAFIFDMDGVIIDSERTWSLYKKDFYEKLLGKEIAEKVGETVGMGIPLIYDVAVTHGLSMKWDEFSEKYNEKAQLIYQHAMLTENLKNLIKNW